MSKAEEALQEGIKNRVTLKELSKLYCAVILEQNAGNKVHASRILDVDRRTLQRWKIGSEANGAVG